MIPDGGNMGIFVECYDMAAMDLGVDSRCRCQRENFLGVMELLSMM